MLFRCFHHRWFLRNSVRSETTQALTTGRKTFKKVLVANRGEVAARVLRSLREMEIESIGIYAYADRFSHHRLRADQSFRIGAGRSPLEAYFDVDRIIEIAEKNNVDAIHPGYGFLAMKPEFAKRVNDSNIAFIGPPTKVIQQMRDKLKARQCATAAKVKVIPGSLDPITTPEEAVSAAKTIGLPVILKPARGSGGRGMQYVDSLSRVAEAFVLASRRAKELFGDSSVIVEKFMDHPRHIEVQVLADKYGNAVHLFDRDCSLQYRQRKFLEVAPARDLDNSIRERLYADALAIARHVGYQNAGTVKFLVGFAGDHHFIGMNARLEMDHCVTEEVTGIDIVQQQVRLAEGWSLPELRLTQDRIKLHGAAIQCQINSEDPSQDFLPHSGRLKVYRIGDGMGVRKDGIAYDGGTVSKHYEPLLSKVIIHASSHQEATKRMLRCLRETRIRGMETNLNFLKRIMMDPVFNEGTVTTSFIEDNQSLLELSPTRNRGMKLLRYMAEVKVNGAFSPLGVPDAKIWRGKPEVPKEPDGFPPEGFKSILDKEGPEGFAKAIRGHKGLLITDTTFRDAHQSLLATRVRTKDMLKIAPHVAHRLNGLRSVENWGGATFQVCMNFLYECPWERLEKLRKAIPNVPFQCIFRGPNIFGYSSFPDNVVNEFCKLAVQTGMDIFRIMDCFNYLPNLRCGIEAVGKAGGVIEAAIAYTGDVANKNAKRYNLEYYLNLVDELVKTGIHILAIKDMAGVLHPSAAKLLIGSIRERYPNLPIQVHTHDTAGTGVASMIAAVEAGADGVDAAIDSMSGISSQPSLGAIVRSMENTLRATGLDLNAISQYSHYWEKTRRLYANFECTDLLKSGTSDIFEHSMPGGQYTNLIFQSSSLNLYDQFPTVCKNYAEADKALGDIIKVAPSSKVVGDLAQFMTQNAITSSEELVEKAELYALPKSVQDFFEGKLGQPTYGFPKVFQEKVLRGKKPITGRPGASLEPLDFDYQRRKLEEKYQLLFSVMSSIMFPKEFDQMVKFRQKYGPVELLPTDVFFAGPEHHRELEIELEKGKRVYVRMTSVGDVNEGRRQVHFEYNGQERSIFVDDLEFAKSKRERAKADNLNPTQHGAPMKGLIVEMKVRNGDKVIQNQDLFVLTAMKMEITVQSKIAGKVKAVLLPVGTYVEAQDLVIIVDPT